ncbi:TetR family transcriptional regulator [Microbacterium sp. AG1240]|uniref:glycoside hydrolase family 3 N-terminal domain-containing protein n=1 Tax=Microbacterium sp. AG1240 TaxID=2183992 RepID=UPI000F2276C6|nr:glycoside hydrolase family 3 N-terminal domain-containing protein [Microbacterium sp. AG1240]RKT35694.1 TetR family transcriptional regulator [Microbacterium sp. AG1240]
MTSALTVTTPSRHSDGTVYRDLNGNGVMDPFEDPRLSVAERVDDLLSRMSLAEKAGLMVQSVVSVTIDGTVDGVPFSDRRPTARELVETRLVTHLNVHQIPEPRIMARWVNEVQKLAERGPHGIPVTVSTDPRHSFTENSGASFSADHLSAWPEPLGLGALGDEAAVREFAAIARQEYLALGIRSALHPTLDVSTEPRWPRQYSTFGQNAEVVARLGLAYIDGFEGDAQLTPTGVACMAKHFPGGGPQRDGEDPHFPYGKEQDYLGGMFEYHLEPFRKIIERGVPAIMPSYGVPMGLVLDGEPIEEVGFGFNRQILTGLLREKLGFDGVICTDWGLVTESRIGDRRLPPRAWGVEHLSELERVEKILAAGADQLGGEESPEWIISLVESGRVTESRIDESVRRLLKVKFELGLFENPYVDEDAAAQLVGTAESRAAGQRAQSRSSVVLANGSGSSSVLPLRRGAKVFAPEMDAPALSGGGLKPVGDPVDAEVIILRVRAPFEPRDRYMLESSFHAGSLEFAPEVEQRLRVLSASAPVVLVVHLDRPAILEPLLPHCAAVLAEFGASDAAVLDVLLGRTPAEGSLPFDVPRTAAAVVTSRPDVPGDLVSPLFVAGQPSAPVKRRAGKRTYAQGRESQDLILETALEVIERKGYSATSLRDIAAEVGMTQAGLLHHFGTKENLLVEVLRQRDIVNRRNLAPSPGDAPMTIRAARHNTHAPALVHLYTALSAAAADPSHPGHEFFLRREVEVLASMRRDIEARQLAGSFPADVDAAQVARVFFALSDGLQAQWGVNPEVDLAGTIEWLWNQFTSRGNTSDAPPE